MTTADKHCPLCGHPVGADDGDCPSCGTGFPAVVNPPAPGVSAGEVPWAVAHVASGLFLFLGLLILAVFSARAIGGLYPAQEAALQIWVAVHLLALGSLATVWLMGLRRAASPLKAIGLVRPQTPVPVTFLWVVGALGFSIVASFAYGLVVDQLGVEALRPPEIDPEIIFPGVGLLLTLQALALVTPFSEEILFRGFVLRGLLQNIGTGPAVVATAVVFSALHLDPGTAIPIFFTGLALGWVYVKTCSLWPCIAAHAGQNLIALLVVEAGI